MSSGHAPPHVNVAVVMMIQNNRVLLHWNPKWGSFSLPMTKVRMWRDDKGEILRNEDPFDAAARAAAEISGTLFSLQSGVAGYEQLNTSFNINDLRQGDRDGQEKLYHLNAYSITYAAGRAVPVVAPGPVLWLTGGEMVDEKLRPISPTAREVAQEATTRGIL